MSRLLNFVKRSIAIITIPVIYIAFSLTSADCVTALNLNTSQMYYKYNASTGAYQSSYILNTLSTLTSNSSRIIHGDDDRVLDYTKSGTVKLMDSSATGVSANVGTGFVIDEHTIATAAHCVYSRRNGEALVNCVNTVDKILLFNSDGTVAMTVTGLQEIHVPKSYTDTLAYEYDYALITVSEDLSDYTLYNLGVMQDGFTGLSDKTIYTTGFPDFLSGSTKANTDTLHSAYTSIGTVTGLGNYLIDHDADTGTGNSGGPLYISTTFQGATYYTVVGIHNVSSGRAVRISSDLLHFYKNNPEL